jgi:predicted NBD/HSP70 family sugar kinase
MPFGRLLCAELGADCQVPILIDCVNRYQAIAEREKGIADGARNFIIIDALDEGIGSGILLHGELLRGSQSISGEIGHLTVNPTDGSECICGARGCFEAMVSAKRVPGMAAAALARGGGIVPVRRPSGGRPPPRRGLRGCGGGGPAVRLPDRRRGSM